MMVKNNALALDHHRQKKVTADLFALKAERGKEGE